MKPATRRGIRDGVLASAFFWGAVWLVSTAWAQSTSLTSCSQTVGATAAAVPFPASGATGASRPKDYVEVCNSHASNNLGINSIGGTAAIGSAGTLTLFPGGCERWEGPAVPAGLSVIGSAAGTTTACGYH